MGSGAVEPGRVQRPGILWDSARYGGTRRRCSVCQLASSSTPVTVTLTKNHLLNTLSPISIPPVTLPFDHDS